MRLLALDLGTTTGWAINSFIIQSGAQSFKQDRFEGGGMRYLKFGHWLAELNGLAGPFDQIIFEEVRRHRGVTAAHAYGGFLATLTAWCEAEKIAYRGIPIGTIKAHATGKGNSGKELMLLAAARILGRAITDDNEADAICLLDWSINNATPRTDHERPASDSKPRRQLSVELIPLARRPRPKGAR